MIPEYTERAALRISQADKQKIDLLIQEGKFKNVSQIMRLALKDFLSREGDRAVSDGQK